MTATRAILFALALAAVGCAAQTAPTTRPATTVYRDHAAVALVYEPPIAADLPRLALARDTREPAAFLGYRQLTVEYFVVHRDDWQMDGYPDQFTRRAISDQSGVRYR